MIDCPVLVISLVDALERRVRIARALELANLDFEFVDAIDGRKGLASDLAVSIDRCAAAAALGRMMSDAEFACSLSHRAAYRRIVDSGMQGAIVLEDDAQPSEAFVRLVHSGVLQRTRFVQFDYGNAFAWRFTRTLACEAADVRLHRSATNSPLATGYFLSAEAAAYLLDKTNPVALPADWPCDLRPLRPYLTIPRVVRSWAQTHDTSYLKAARDALRRNSVYQSPSDTGLNRSQMRNPLPKGFAYWRRLLCKRIPKARN